MQIFYNVIEKMYKWNPFNSGLVIPLKKVLMLLISRIRLRRRFETEPLTFSVEKAKIKLQWVSKIGLTLIGMRGWYFYLLVLFWSDFVSWIFIKNFQTFLEVKIDINLVNLTPSQAYCILSIMPLGGTKDEHFSCFHSSCHWRLMK